MVYYVYILYAESFDRYYKGHTKDLFRRFARHQAGKEASTAAYRPWQLLWYTEKPTRASAMALERKLKNLTKAKIRRFIARYPNG